ncbi:MAG: flagellar M-ring protein FliF [Solirubrobacteraceae bacterium]
MGALTAMSTRGKIVLAASGLAILFVAFLLFRVASAPSYTTLQAGIDPAKTGKITAALDQAGVSYKLQSNGTAVAVVSGQESKARVALAGQGLAAGGSQPGFELLDKQKLGASTFQQQVAYQRALEGQISQTIGQIDGISGAQVQLTLPKDDLFATEKQPATAAVLLTADSATLDPAAVRGIASLVASSVQDLKPSNVTITDASGSMLWPQGDGTDSGAGSASKPAAEARYASAMQSTLGALIARTVGSDKAQVQVHADLNVDKASEEQLQYAKKGTPLESNVETETLKGTGGAGASKTGANANIPQYAQNAASGGGNSNYKRKTDKTTYGVDKKVVKRTIAPGAVNKLDVALLVDKSVPAAQATALKNAVAAAAGINPKRGDTITQSAIAFTKPKAAAGPAGLPVPPGFMAPLKYAGIGLASILFLFFVTRALRKREQEAIPMPTWLSEIEGPRPLAELERSTSSTPAALAAESGGSQVDSLVRDQPERVAQQLRAWISEDTP